MLPFQEKEVAKYFGHFEKVANSLNWLVGKAQEIYGSLSVEAEVQRAYEEAQKARDAGKALQDAQLAAQLAGAEKARELRLAELKEARELELKAEQEKAFLVTEIEAKKEATAHEHELKRAGLGKHSPLDRPSAGSSEVKIRF